MKEESDKRHSGGKKKFLYTGPKSKKPVDEDQWTFAPACRKTSPSSGLIDLDDVWSIKKNVGIGNSERDKLNLNANKNFYSRHGGMKEKNRTESSSPGPLSQRSNDGSVSWSQSRRGFSYSYGNTDERNSPSDPSSSGRGQGGNRYGHRPPHLEDPNDF